MEQSQGDRQPRGRSFMVGQRIKGKIIRIQQSSGDVMVDMGGGKLTGVIEKRELIDEATGEITVKIGDIIDAFVVSKQGDEILLSHKMSAALKSLEDLEMAKAKRLPVRGRVSKAIKGGFEVTVLGKTGFCPISQIDLKFVEGNGQTYVGQEYEFLIEKVEAKGRNIVLSRGALLRQRAEEQAKAVVASLASEPDKIWPGTVTELRDFGAFVDIGGVDGLVHVSELTHGRVNKASDVVSKGDKVKVKVLKVDQDAQGRPKISLSMKATSQDPWDAIDDHVSPGKTYSAHVVSVMPFGAFVELTPGIEGLVHISEMSWIKRIHHPSDVVKVGDPVTVQVKDIDRAQRRIALTMKAIEDDPWNKLNRDFKSGQMLSGTVERLKPFGAIVVLSEGLSGLVPISILRKKFGEAYKSQCTPGKVLDVKIMQADDKERKISLTLAGVDEEDADKKDYAEYLAAEESAAKARAQKVAEEAGGAQSASGSFGALLSAKLRGQKK